MRPKQLGVRARGLLAAALTLALLALPAHAAFAKRAAKPTVSSALPSLQHSGAITPTAYAQYASVYPRPRAPSRS